MKTLVILYGRVVRNEAIVPTAACPFVTNVYPLLRQLMRLLLTPPVSLLMLKQN
ncbi:MAG: hypothetical protein V7K79_26655 [Nostoc sp.]